MAPPAKKAQGNVKEPLKQQPQKQHPQKPRGKDPTPSPNLPYVCNNFIPRKFKWTVDIEIKRLYDSDPSDKFLIISENSFKLIAEDLTQKYKIPRHYITTENNIDITSKIVISSSPSFSGQKRMALKKQYPNYNIHVLEYKGNDQFKWMESPNSDALKRLKRVIKPDIYSNYLVPLTRPATIIYADYGMGKTQVLKKIQRDILETSHNNQVIEIDYKILRTFFKGRSETPQKGLADFIKYFKIDVRFLFHIMVDNIEDTNSFHVLLLLLCDLQKTYKEKVKLWFTCSNIVFTEHLEIMFATLSCVLTPLSPNQQVDYLKKNWPLCPREDSHTEHLLKSCNQFYWKQCISALNYAFTSYPAHLIMLCRIFQNLPPDFEKNILEYKFNLLTIFSNYFSDISAAEEIQLSDAAYRKLRIIYDKDPAFMSIRSEDEALLRRIKSRYQLEYCIVAYGTREMFRDVLSWGCTTWFFFHIFNRLHTSLHVYHTEVMNDNVEYIKENVDEEVINSTDEYGRSLLHLATSKGMVDTLIAKGIDMNLKDDIFQCTAMKYFDYTTFVAGIDAMLYYQIGVTELNAICAGASAKEMMTRLHTAIRLRLENVVIYIIFNYKNIIVTPWLVSEVMIYLSPSLAYTFVSRLMDSSGRFEYFKNHKYIKDALYFAVRHFCNEAFIYLVKEMKCNIQNDDYSVDLFRFACGNKNIELVEFLYRQHKWKVTVAQLDCCKNDNVEMFHYLYSYLATSDQEHKALPHLEQLLWIACRAKSQKVADYIVNILIGKTITRGTITNAMLEEAIICPLPRLLHFILEPTPCAQINLDAPNSTIYGSFMHLACMQNNLYGLYMLLRNSANVHVQDKKGRTPLFFAHYSQNIYALIALITHDRNTLYHVSKHQENALHSFVRGDPNVNESKTDIRMIEILIENGVDVHKSSIYDETPADLAKALHKTEILKLLKKHI